MLGFRESGSHRLVDLAECPVLHSDIFTAAKALRGLLSARKRRFAADIELTLAEQGVDAAIKGLTVEGLEQTEALLDFARSSGLARLTLDQGFGPEAMWEPEPVTVALAGVSVPLPPGAFLQATADGEAALADAAKTIAIGLSFADRDAIRLRELLQSAVATGGYRQRYRQT